MTDSRRKICLLLLILFISTSSGLAKLSKSLEVSLAEKSIQHLSFSGLTIVFYVKITNISSKPAYIVRYDYRFEVNQTEYLNLLTDIEETIKVEPKEVTVISFPVKITYENLFQAMGGIEGEDRAVCYLAGGLTFSDGKRQVERIPVAFSADFPILKEPEVEFLAFEINELTIGGADLILRVLFKNRNSFELLVDKLNYRLELEKRQVIGGTVAGNKNIEGKGEKTFAFPMLFNFFEVGKEIYDILRQPSAFCNFSGEAEVMTAWGKVRIPYRKAEVVTFSRVD